MVPELKELAYELPVGTVRGHITGYRSGSNGEMAVNLAMLPESRHAVLDLADLEGIVLEFRVFRREPPKGGVTLDEALG